MQLKSNGTTNVTDGLLAAHTHTLTGYRDMLRGAYADTTYASTESALAAPSDRQAIHEAETLARDLSPKLTTVILVGIGGSDLGTRALYDALGGYADTLTRNRRPRLVCFGTVEPAMLSHIDTILEEHTSPEEIALVVISKSGTTSETIVNANVLYRALTKRFGDAAASRTIVISDAGAPLAAHARSAGMRHIAMPAHIGGRFSVFTPVGLVPLALLGIDVTALCDGAAAAARAATPEYGAGPAAMLAALLFEHYLNGVSIHELFLFHPELETLGKWYRQLLAESIGKERADGTRVGIMPTVAIGTTDLHSLAQLVVGGPKNRFTTFVTAPNAWTGDTVCAPGSPFCNDALSGKRIDKVLTSILGGVQATYKNHGLPYVTVELSEISERELGAFMALHMAMVMYLGKLFDVNAFDQPAVEAYKSEAKRLLAR